jgi:serine/threonine protein kinase
VAKFYAAEILLFFEDLHSKNIVYRDLKPENILLDSMGHVRVTDMVSCLLRFFHSSTHSIQGFAKFIKKKRTYTFCGTPQYIAPEVILSAEVGPKSGGYGFSVDYYSLGVLIYELLAGQTPFHDHNVRAIYRRVLYGTVEFPWGMDAAAKDLIKSLLQRNVGKRLGCGPGQSLDDIKRHRWFRGIDWEQLRRREVTPPFVPRFSHAGDTSNFIPWGRDKPSVDEQKEEFGDVFKDF